MEKSPKSAFPALIDPTSPTDITDGAAMSKAVTLSVEPMTATRFANQMPESVVDSSQHLPVNMVDPKAPNKDLLQEFKRKGLNPRVLERIESLGIRHLFKDVINSPSLNQVTRLGQSSRPRLSDVLADEKPLGLVTPMPEPSSFASSLPSEQLMYGAIEFVAQSHHTYTMSAARLTDIEYQQVHKSISLLFFHLTDEHKDITLQKIYEIEQVFTSAYQPAAPYPNIAEEKAAKALSAVVMTYSTGKEWLTKAMVDQAVSVVIKFIKAHWKEGALDAFAALRQLEKYRVG
jgi:hypothetical protein